MRIQKLGTRERSGQCVIDKCAEISELCHLIDQLDQIGCQRVGMFIAVLRLQGWFHGAAGRSFMADFRHGFIFIK